QVFATLANGNFFTSLDLTDAYTQLQLDTDSQELCVVNTHKGLYKLTRLIYGVSSAAAIFQSTMDKILNGIAGAPVTVDRISEASLADPSLKKIYDFTYFGWPNSNPFPTHSELSVYYKIRDQLSISEKCVLYGSRVVIPPSLQSECLSILHMGHPGINKTKMLARVVLWWPSLNSDIENLCSYCDDCVKVNSQSKKVFIPWAVAKHPFERVHVDFYCYKQTTFFIFVDSYSKWIHIQPTLTTVASAVNQVLFSLFSFWGCLPSVLVSDNGPPFCSIEFRDFLTRFNIVLKHSPVYHPQSNGLAERGVGIAKKALEKMFEELK
ncbi:hypothetical protein KUF71_002391, partial [Frankliniella fusca]